jgi:hypothetical protein
MIEWIDKAASSYCKLLEVAIVAANLDLLKKNDMTVTQFAPAGVARLRK